MKRWMYVGANTTVYWPGKSLATRASSQTTTAGDSQTANAGVTTILSVQTGSTHTSGALTFYAHDGTTVLRTMASAGVAAGKMNDNTNYVPWSIQGGFSVANTTSGGAVEVYIQYEYDEKVDHNT